MSGVKKFPCLRALVIGGEVMRCAWAAGLLGISFICCFDCMCRSLVFCCLLAVGTPHFKKAPSISAAKAVVKPKPLKPPPPLPGPVYPPPGEDASSNWGLYLFKM
jgi:hypothetical protein